MRNSIYPFVLNYEIPRTSAIVYNRLFSDKPFCRSQCPPYKCVSIVGCMIDSNGLAERAKDYRMNAGGITGTDSVHTDSTFYRGPFSHRRHACPERSRRGDVMQNTRYPIRNTKTSFRAQHTNHCHFDWSNT